MLWLKAWGESRARFWLGAAILSSGCAAYATYYNHLSLARGVAAEVRLDSYPRYIDAVIFAGAGSLRLLFCVLVILLGAGGLLRERVHRTTNFTLALPVRRWRLSAARCAMGILQILALAFIPALVITLLSPLLGASYPLARALTFGVLWSAGGCIFFAMSFLCSTFIEGEYASSMISLIGLGLYSFAADRPLFRSYHLDLNEIMSSGIMPGAAQLRVLIGIAVAVIILMTLANHLMHSRDF